MVAFSQKDGVKIKRMKFNYKGLKGNFQEGTPIWLRSHPQMVSI